MTLNDEYQSMAANAIAHAAQMAGHAWQNAAYDRSRPSVIWKPKLSIDGNQWCAMYGDDLQNGVAGFGDSPELAMYDFDAAWGKKLTTPNAKVTGVPELSARPVD